MSDRMKLIEILKDKSVKTGTFTLASGKKSDFYVDVRQTALHREGAGLIGKLLLRRLKPEVVAIGGMTLGADPLVSAAAAMSVDFGRPVHAFIIRKEAKGHGTGAYIEGTANLYPGDQVCMVEDTTTTGGSLLKAIDRAEEFGLEVVQCITIVDREEGAYEALADRGLQLEAITRRSHLV